MTFPPANPKELDMARDRAADLRQEKARLEASLIELKAERERSYSATGARGLSRQWRAARTAIEQRRAVVVRRKVEIDEELAHLKRWTQAQSEVPASSTSTLALVARKLRDAGFWRTPLLVERTRGELLLAVEHALAQGGCNAAG